MEGTLGLPPCMQVHFQIGLGKKAVAAEPSMYKLSPSAPTHAGCSQRLAIFIASQ
jgi:hypothetical protein